MEERAPGIYEVKLYSTGAGVDEIRIFLSRLPLCRGLCRQREPKRNPVLGDSLIHTDPSGRIHLF